MQERLQVSEGRLRVSEERAEDLARELQVSYTQTLSHEQSSLHNFMQLVREQLQRETREHERLVRQQQRDMEEKDKQLRQQQKDMEEKDRQLQQQQRDMELKDRQLQQQQRDMEEKDRQLQHQQRETEVSIPPKELGLVCWILTRAIYSMMLSLCIGVLVPLACRNGE